MPATPVYIVCSPRPQVGKTVVARLLTEFLLLKDGEVTAFDINLKEPSLLDYLPDLTETADVSDTYGKIALMDRVIVDDGTAKVIDLGFHAFDEFFTMLHEIGFIKEAQRRNIAPLVLFLAHIPEVLYRPADILLHQLSAAGPERDQRAASVDPQQVHRLPRARIGIDPAPVMDRQRNTLSREATMGVPSNLLNMGHS